MPQESRYPGTLIVTSHVTSDTPLELTVRGQSGKAGDPHGIEEACLFHCYPASDTARDQHVTCCVAASHRRMLCVGGSGAAKPASGRTSLSCTNEAKKLCAHSQNDVILQVSLADIYAREHKASASAKAGRHAGPSWDSRFLPSGRASRGSSPMCRTPESFWSGSTAPERPPSCTSSKLARLVRHKSRHRFSVPCLHASELLVTELRVIIRQFPQSRPLASTPRNSSTKASSFRCGMWAARLPGCMAVPYLSVDGTSDQVPCQCGFVMDGGFLTVVAGEDPSPVEVLLSGSARNHLHGRFVGP